MVIEGEEFIKICDEVIALVMTDEYLAWDREEERKMNNPLREFKKRELIEAGVYEAKLENVSSKQILNKRSGEKETKLMFLFKTIGDHELTSFFYPSSSPNSALVKFMRGMVLNLQGSIVEDRDEFWQLIQDQVGKSFTLMVSNDGQYNNIQAATPFKGVPTSMPTNVPLDKAGNVIADDDIPF